MNLGQETTAKPVPNLLLLGPKTLDLASTNDYKTDCINVSFPRSLIKNGLYFLSVEVNSDGGKFRATESERHESGEEVWYDLNFKHNLRTGQLQETSMLDEYYTEHISNTASIPPKAAQMDSFF